MRLPYPEPDWRAGIKSRKPETSPKHRNYGAFTPFFLAGSYRFLPRHAGVRFHFFS